MGNISGVIPGTIIGAYPVTIFADRAKAAELAHRCGSDDPETEYRVEKFARGWVVAVYEPGQRAPMGAL